MTTDKILIISRGAGFMVDALDTNLKKAGFITDFAEPAVKSIEDGRADCDIVLLMADDYVYNSVDALVYIKDIISDDDIPLCVIGYDQEIAEIKKYIPEDRIHRIFKRPFDAKYVTEELLSVAEVAYEKRLGKRILLVDDDPTFLKMLQGWLSDKYRITAVKSGMQAITYIANHKPDLILLDYDMPITPGPQVMEMIRSEFDSSEIPIIFLTGKSDRESIMRVMKLKPQGYLNERMNMNERVVVVDDDAIILKQANMTLMEAGFKVTCLKNGKLLMDYIKMNPIDILLLDIRMPEMDGFETIQALREWEVENSKEAVPVIFLTANEDAESEAMGLTLGAIDFIKKPFSSEVLKIRVRNILDLILLQKDLQGEVQKKTSELESLSLHVVQTLAKTIDAKDAYTNGHSERVAEYSREIAKRYGYDEAGQEEIYMMGLLHDVGKIGVPDTVINKPGRLTDEEFGMIKKHPIKGAEILATVSEMPKLVTGARWHHERFDGNGYPDGLKGEDIPEEARIIAVADAYDAMTSHRSYRDIIPQDHVKSEIENGMGTQFDEKFARIMLDMIAEDTEYTMHE